MQIYNVHQSKYFEEGVSKRNLLSSLEETCKPKPKHEILDGYVSCRSEHTMQAHQQAFPGLFPAHPEIFKRRDIKYFHRSRSKRKK